MNLNTIYHHDVSRTPWPLDAKSVHCIVTSPPYWGLRDYGVPPQKWPRIRYAPMAGMKPITIPAMECCLGLEPTIEAFIGHMVYVFREAKRILRNDGIAWVNMGDSYNAQQGKQNLDKLGEQYAGGGHKSSSSKFNLTRPMPAGLKRKDLIGQPWRLAFALQADGWYLRKDNIWAKRNCMPESCADRSTTAHEYIFQLTLSEKYFYDQDAVREPAGNDESKYKSYHDPEDVRYDSAADPERWKHQFNGRTWGTVGRRNLRSVWHLATQPFPEAHFATFPEALPEICIKASTSERGVCSSCGAQWERVIKPTEEYAKKLGKSFHDHKDDLQVGQRDVPRAHNGVSYETTGWRPTCKCESNTPVPATVCDIFMGSGTLGRVAYGLGRNYVGLEINPSYIAMANKRIKGPLFVETELPAV